MRFYQSSTGAAREERQQPEGRASLQQPPVTLQLGSNPVGLFPFYFNHYCGDLLSLANFLNQELLRNNQLISQRHHSLQPSVPPAAQPLKDSEDNSTASRNNASQSGFARSEVQRLPSGSSHRPPIRRRKRSESISQESYKPEDDMEREGTGRVSESKNVPKNYGKAILNFIRRNQGFTQKVLAREGIDPHEFQAELQQLRSNLNTISQLRGMWTDGDNRFARAFRIFSGEYLRKHSLSYIFNSRVENFHKHIKYRYKIMQSVAAPADFTCMKEF